MEERPRGAREVKVGRGSVAKGGDVVDKGDGAGVFVLVHWREIMFAEGVAAAPLPLR